MMKARVALMLGTLLLLAGCGRPAPAPAPTEAPAQAPVADPAPKSTPASTPAPAPVQAPATVATKEPVRTYKVSIAFSATGDLRGDGRPLVAEVLAEEPHPHGYWPETITLQVREPGGTVLASTEVRTTQADGLDLVDFAQNGRPLIVLRSRHFAVIDHMAYVHVFRFDGHALQLEANFSGWQGGSGIEAYKGRPAVRLGLWYNPPYTGYLPVELICTMCARPHHTQWIGWKDGQVALLAEESTRLAYAKYRPQKFEDPLPPEAVALLSRGEALLAAGKPAEAMGPLQQAIALEPRYPDALNDLSYAYALQGNWAESWAAAAKAVELNPWHPFAQFNLGVALLQLGKPQEAEQPLSTATGLQLDRWEPHYYLGLCYERQGKAAKALAEFQKAAAIQPGAPGVQDALQRLTR